MEVASSTVGRNLPPPDAPAVTIDANTCPATGTYATITYPMDGAIDIPTPVPIAMHVFIPNTLDGKGIYLSDASGQQNRAHRRCDVDRMRRPVARFRVQLACLITCDDASGIHEIATSTFTTAP